jgi:DNA-binding NarL/FixJ family response regulator
MDLTSPTPIRVLVVEGFRLVAQALHVLLGAEPDIEVVGYAVTAAEAISLATELKPDVVVIDFWLAGASGANTATEIARIVPDVKTLFLGSTIGSASLTQAVRAGARGYLLKSDAAYELLNAVRRVARGELLIPAAVLADVLREEDQDRRPLGRLTPRELELLKLLAEGLDNKAIAVRLDIRYVTVRSHLRNLMEKLNCHSKLEAVARAYELGLIES